MVRPRVGIVIPALNEAATIESVVRQSAVFGTPIVVDDGSSDETGQIAAAAGAVVLRHERNYGYDISLHSGFRCAAELDLDMVVTIDADGQHDPELIKQCLELLDGGADFVVGVRHKCQRFSEYIFAFVTKTLYGLKDPLCGFKGYRMTMYRDLGHFDSYGSIGTELALFGVRNGYTFRQPPVGVIDRQGNPRFGQGLQANYKILRSLFLAFWNR
jgi:glycosyltransferase involved in cell wall biosynthesis